MITESASGLTLVTRYPLGRTELGGSGWVDRRLVPALRAIDPDLEVVCVTGPTGTHPATGPDDPTWHAAGEVPLEVRADRAALARIAARIAVRREPYLTAKFTAFGGWRTAVDGLRSRAAGRRIVTSGWPALLLAAHAGVEVAVHIAHNVESVIAAEHSPRPLRALGDVRLLEHEERRLLAHPASVLALSRTDAAMLRDRWGVDAGAIPIPLVPKTVDRPDTATVGFIGKASWPPNARALEELLGPVHHELTALGVGPDQVGYVLAGTGTEAHAAHPRVRSAGRVADEADFYRAVGLAAVPRFGASTGVSVKVLEACEYGVASVLPSTLAAALDPDGPWLVADDAAAVAATIVAWAHEPSSTTTDAVRSWTALRTASAASEQLGREQRDES